MAIEQPGAGAPCTALLAERGDAALQAAEDGREAVAALSGLQSALYGVLAEIEAPWTCSRSESSHRNADHQDQVTAAHLDGR